MRAREIERWFVHIMHDGATDLVDAEIAKHVVRVFELCEAMREKLRPRDARSELLGGDDTMGELHTSLALLHGRARMHEAERLKREAKAA